ncbi:transposase [Psychrobacter sp. ANT_WB68]|nr:transposase [Psychrobacter sp. ANT_WB68]
MKLYRAIATRYDKLASHFLTTIHLVSCIIWLN